MKVGQIKEMRQLLYWVEGFSNKMNDLLEGNTKKRGLSDCCGAPVWTESIWSEALHVDCNGHPLDYGEFDFDWVDYSDQYRCADCAEECSIK